MWRSPLSGIEFLHFLSGLILVGVGWNFLFIGGTTLLTEAYRPAERAKAQAMHDFLMYTVVALASFSAGGLLNHWGWNSVNVTVLPFLLVAGTSIVALAVTRRPVPRSASPLSAGDTRAHCEQLQRVER